MPSLNYTSFDMSKSKLNCCCFDFKGPLSVRKQLLATERFWKIMNNAFCFMQDVLKMFPFFSWLFGHVGKHPDKKAKFMTSKTRKQTITIHILHNILRSKGNQTMKFGQLVKYFVRNIFLQKSCRKWEMRLVPDLSLCYKKALYKGKAGGQHLRFNMVR